MSALMRFVAARPPRGGLLSAAVVALVLAGCQEQRVNVGTQLDVIPPVVTIALTAGDTQDVNNDLKFGVTVNDNLGIKTISIQLTGGHTARIDSTYRTALTNISLPVTVTFPSNTTAGGWIYVRVTAADGNNNLGVAQDSILLTNINALIVLLQRPILGSITSPGRGIEVQVVANQNNGVKKIGWLSSAPVPDGDSINTPVIPPANYPDSAFFTDTLTVPGTILSGTFDVVGFAEDSSGRRVTTPPIVVTIQSVATDTTKPLVTFNVLDRVEIRDSIIVRALDGSGITDVAWTATDLLGNPVGGANVVHGGTLTDITQAFNLNLNFTTFPQTIVLRATATDAATNVGQSRTQLLATAPFLVDTITVVAGITKPLPAGGRVADAIYNKNLDEIYMTNVDLNRVEVFRIADTSFATSIFTGARPWGISLWPRDTLGNNADTVIVANSGGTNLSIIDVSLARRAEVRRQALPIFNVFSVQTARDPATGGIVADITNHRFADRPQYLGSICRLSGALTCKPAGAGDVIVFYSTTPTPGQTTPFPLRGTIRWENLTPTGTANRDGHFVWEHAGAQVNVQDANDTLRIEVVRGATTTRLLDEVCGETVSIKELAFLDTTIVRNSGNFARVFIGEAGTGEAPLVFSRVIAYDGNATITPTCARPLVAPGTFPLSQDLGISPPANVRNFITNASSAVKSIGTNFNGLTNLVRADSIYVLDRHLRLQGLLQVAGPNPGMDLNFDHKFDAACGGTPGSSGTICTPNGFSPNDRLLFSARPDANIDVFDTYWYGRVFVVPLRDPIIGPLRVAKLPTNEQVLIGVTARGIVVARLPSITNTYPVSPMGNSDPIRYWGAPLR